MIKCKDCPYFWADGDGENFYCHYQYNDGFAPCEADDNDKETEDIDED